jgi:hypothetical protein
MTELIGRSLGNYQLEALIAAGPTGHLYSGRHIRLGRSAAIKLFDPALLGRPGVRPRLLAALSDIANLRHPHIAALYDVGDEDGRLFLATEQLAGGSLRALMEVNVREALPLPTRLELLAQAAEGLAAAHAAGLVHGAIKPESLWLERRPGDGTLSLKLTDLGVAGVLSEEAFGAPAYLSPEQCRGQALDGRSDIYSLGVVLYELLVGVPPFNVRTVEAAVEKHLRTRPVPPRMVRPQVPEAVESIALRCLAKLPEERYPDASALATALRQAGGGIVPAPPAPTLVVAPIPALAVNEQPTQRITAPITVAPAPRVQVLGPQGAVLREADLASGAITVGRAPERDLFLDDPQISREHLRIAWDGQRVTVTDLGSANGSHIGATRLAPNLAVPWDETTTLKVGPFNLRLALPPGLAPAEDGLLSGLLSSAAATAVAPAAPPPPPPAVPGRVELRVDQERLTLTPGAPAMVPLRLINTGATPAEVGLSVEGVPGAWLREADQQVIRLEPGAQAAASLTVTPPRTADSLAGDYNVVVRARNLSGAEAGVARLRWTVLPFKALDMRIAPPRAETQAAADYQVLMRNQGNAAASYFLSFEDEDEMLGYALERDEITLEAGESARVGLRVEAAGRLFGGPEERSFTVRADDGQREAAVAEAQIVHQATLPPWVPLAALGALALALALGAWAFFGNRDGGDSALAPTTAVTPIPPTLTPFPTPLPGAPTVEVFTAEPALISPGELITVSWRVSGAERVFIDQFGDVPAEGQRQFRPEQTTDFRLTAIAPGGRETVVIARVSVAPATATPQPTATATLQPTQTPLPTLTPIPPTAVPPTAVPPTAVPPTAVPPTAVPPTAVPPTAVPPTAVLPTVAPPSGGATIDLAAPEAPSALWRTNAGTTSFGRPLFGADRGGWAAISDATLEDGQPYQGLLQMVPPAAAQPRQTTDPAAGPFVEGEYTLQPLQNGQIFVAAVGFPQGAASQSVTVTVSFEGQILYQGSKAPDGTLLPIFVDLSSLAGRGGKLILRTSGDGQPSPSGVYWVRPRIDVPR